LYIRVGYVDPSGKVLVTGTAVVLSGLAVTGAAAAPVAEDIGKWLGNIVWNEGIDENTDMTDPSTWPKPPVEGECEVGDPSRSKPRKRGEKSLWDSAGGEWRPHKPDKHHPKGHWDHKPPGPNSLWINVPVK